MTINFSFTTHFTSKVEEIGRCPVWEASHTFTVEHMVRGELELFK